MIPVHTAGRHSFFVLGRQCFDVVSCWVEVGILGVVDIVVVVAGVPAGSRLAWWIAVVAVVAVGEGGRSCCRCS